MVIHYLEASKKWCTTGVYPGSCPVKHLDQWPGEEHGVYSWQFFKWFQFQGNSPHTGTVTTEGDLDRLTEWANRNHMKYSMDKCQVRDLRRKNSLQWHRLGTDQLCKNGPGGSRQTVLFGPLRSLPTWTVWEWWINAEIVSFFIV